MTFRVEATFKKLSDKEKIERIDRFGVFPFDQKMIDLQAAE